VFPGITIVIHDASAGVLTRIVVETSVMHVPMVVLEVTVTVATPAYISRRLEPEIVDQETLVQVEAVKKPFKIISIIS
jgi:hypothetical protein